MCPCSIDCAKSFNSISELQRHIIGRPRNGSNSDAIGGGCKEIRAGKFVYWKCPREGTHATCDVVYTEVADVLQHLEHVQHPRKRRCIDTGELLNSSRMFETHLLETSPAVKDAVDDGSYENDCNQRYFTMDDAGEDEESSLGSDISVVEFEMEPDTDNSDDDVEIEYEVYPNDGENNDRTDMESEEVECEVIDSVEPLQRLALNSESISGEDITVVSVVSKDEFQLAVRKAASPIMEDLIELYRFAVDDQLTTTQYVKMLNLKAFQSYKTTVPEGSLPKNISTLKAAIAKFLSQWVNLKQVGSLQLHGKSFQYPYMTMTEALSSMLADRETVNAVLSHMLKHLGFSKLSDVGVLESLLERRKAAINECRDYAFSTIGCGLGYLQNLLDTRALWSSNYQMAVTTGTPVLFLSLSIFEDDFTMKMGSRYGQSVFMLTLLEGDSPGPRITSLKTQILMLVNSKLTKGCGDSALWSRYTAETHALAKGRLFELDGVKTMVFAFVLLCNGDTPGVKRYMGFSSASTNTFACPLCLTRYKDFSACVADVTLIGATRTKEMLLSTPSEKLEDIGMKEKSVVFTWAGHGDPQRMVIDLMHALCLGTSRKFFILIFGILCEGMTVAKQEEKWKEVSIIFEGMCKENETFSGVFSRFKDAKTFKSNLTAWSMKVFTKLSPHILRCVQLLPEYAVTVRQKKQVEAMEAWCRYVKVEEILHQHRISSSDLRLLREFIPLIMRYWSVNFPPKLVLKNGKEKLKPGIFTLKTHYFCHFVDQIIQWGPIVKSSNFSREGMIGRTKSLYHCTNHINRESQVFHHYRIMQFFSVMNVANGITLGYQQNIFPAAPDGKDIALSASLVEYLRSVDNIVFVESDLRLHLVEGRNFSNPFQFIFASPVRLNHCWIKNYSMKHSFLNHKKRKSRRKKTAKVDDCILMKSNAHITEEHTGYFMCLVKLPSLNSMYLMYKLPVEDSSSVEYKYLHVNTVSLATESTVMVVPLHYFIKRLDRVMNEDEQSFTVII